MQRRLPVGAEPHSSGTHFRVWAPDHEHVQVVLPSRQTHDLEPECDGWFNGVVTTVRTGDTYQLRLSDGADLADPASRYQPEGPHGPSVVIDPDAYEWCDQDWRGPDDGRQVVYEMHIGTFTPEGTWSAAATRLPQLGDLGITIIEVMPVMEFPGRFGWGYDVASLFAPSHLYGAPDDMRAFVDAAHSLGIAVILDVVYNHTGPDGCYLARFASAYYSSAHRTDWGPALNFDGAHSAAVREFFLANVEYWIREFHLDGLRFDATQSIYDSSPRHILAEMTARAHTAADGRRLWIVAENEPQDTRLIRDTAAGGYGMDAVWNDDFHHTAMVALTGVREAYYTDYTGSPQELISCARSGFLYQGQYYRWQHKRRGTTTRGVPARRFVSFIQNHDQIANSDSGRRIHELAHPAELRALTTLMLLMPGTPMLFQGQETASPSRFLYFADHHPELAAKVSEGRREFLTQFRSMKLPDVQARLHEPADPATFAACIIDSEPDVTNEMYQLHRDLIRLCRADPVLSDPDALPDGAVLADRAFVLRFRSESEDDRLLVVNHGPDIELTAAAEPLLAPPTTRKWQMLFSSESPEYGGRGGQHPEHAAGWRIQARSAVVLAAFLPEVDSDD